MGLANLITIVRIALVPVYLFLVFSDPRPVTAEGAAAPALAVFVFSLAAMSDWLDGWIARRTGTITRLGQFLDPLADKVLIGAALISLVWLRGFPAWAASVIVIRELAVSVARSAWLRRGVTLPASASGKLKTMLQVPMVVLWLMPRRGAMVVVQDLVAYAAVGLTLYSGWRFFTRSRLPTGVR